MYEKWHSLLGGFLMKKIALIMLAAVLVMSLIACSNGGEEETNNAINDYIAPSYTHKTETGTLSFADGVGETAIITDYAGAYTAHAVTVPAVISERDVVSIGKQAFYQCAAMTAITLPDSLVTIDDWAFAACTGLETIVIPASVTSIGDYAFQGCTSLKSVVFLGTELESIGDFAFNDCVALETIALPEGLESIGIQAFGDCEALTAITAPSTLKSIGNLAFADCTALNTEGALKLSASIEEIGEFAFSGINKKYIHAPEGSYAAEYVSEMADMEEATEAASDVE